MYRGSIYGSFDNKSYAGQLLVKSVIALLVLLPILGRIPQGMKCLSPAVNLSWFGIRAVLQDSLPLSRLRVRR